MNGYSESSAFRILHTEKIGTENLQIGDTSLSVFSDKVGTVKCLWTGLHIRTERLSGSALINTDEVLKTLTGMRIAFRGQTITFIATSPDYGGEFVVAQLQQSLPPGPTILNIFTRAAGRDGEIQVLLKQLMFSSQTADAEDP